MLFAFLRSTSSMQQFPITQKNGTIFGFVLHFVSVDPSIIICIFRLAGRGQFSQLAIFRSLGSSQA